MKVDKIKCADGIKKANKRFDYQINRIDDRYLIHKEIFNMTLDFTIDDWKKIRNDDWYKMMEKINKEDLYIFEKEHKKREYAYPIIKEYYEKNFSNNM